MTLDTLDPLDQRGGLLGDPFVLYGAVSYTHLTLPTM